MTKKNPAIREVVERYYATIADLAAPPKALGKLLAKEAAIREHPNAITPHGSVRGRKESVAGFESGKALLSAQEYVLHEVLVENDRAAVRATWKGTIGEAAGPLPAGTELLAHVASFLTVRDGVVVEQETFDCYEPFGVPAVPSPPPSAIT